MNKLESIIELLLPELIEFRHSLHAYPELGYQEFETSKRIIAELEKLEGLEIRTGVAKTGIVATLGASKQGPCIALRADIDALPIQETSGKPYASKRPGHMHACGHDGHITCLLGAAKILTRLADQLKGPVKFIFQPAEEMGFGGKVMCEEGALENPKVQAIFGLHGWPTYSVGKIGCISGPLLASVDDFTVTVKGRGTHAAFPHLGVDPVLIASHIVVALQTLVSRALNPLDSAVVTVAMIHGGTAQNVIPDEVELGGTLRTLKSEVRNQALQDLERIVNQTAKAYGASAEVVIEPGYPAVCNNPEAFKYFSEVLKDVYGPQALVSDELPVMGAEDFSYYLEHVPGAFWFLGVKPPNEASYPSLHNSKFDFSDAAIAYGVRLHTELALRFADSWAV